MQLATLDNGEVKRIWQANSGDTPLPGSLPKPEGAVTNLTSGLDFSVSSERKAGEGAVLLITDGQQNAGDSPLATAKVLAGKKMPVFTLGTGSQVPPLDLAILRTVVPESVYHEDVVRGEILLKEEAPANQPITLTVRDGDKVVWEKQLVTETKPTLTVPFEFPVKELAAARLKALPEGVEALGVPRELKVAVTALDGERELSNNESNLRFRAVTQKRKVLLEDGGLKETVERDWDLSEEEARLNLAKLTPKISELALALAKEEAALKLVSARQAGQAAVTAPETNRIETRPQLARQQDINHRIDTLKDLIRADANERNVLKKDDRERMRDADTVLATLKDPPPMAEEAPNLATEDLQAGLKKSDLERATEQERKTVDALNLIARHYAAIEQGNILRAQAMRKDPTSTGGWLYEPDSAGADMSVTCWQTMALRAAQNAGMEVPGEAIEKVVGYIKRMSMPVPGQTGPNATGGFEYSSPGTGVSTTAEGLLAMQVCGQYDAKETIAAGNHLLTQDLKAAPHFYYTMYYYAQGMYQRGGKCAEQSTI